MNARPCRCLRSLIIAENQKPVAPHSIDLTLYTPVFSCCTVVRMVEGSARQRRNKGKKKVEWATTEHHPSEKGDGKKVWNAKCTETPLSFYWEVWESFGWNRSEDIHAHSDARETPQCSTRCLQKVFSLDPWFDGNCANCANLIIFAEPGVAEDFSPSLTFLNSANVAVGVTIMIALGYVHAKFMATIHENDMWFSNIRVSDFFNTHVKPGFLSYLGLCSWFLCLWVCPPPPTPPAVRKCPFLEQLSHKVTRLCPKHEWPVNGQYSTWFYLVQFSLCWTGTLWWQLTCFGVLLITHAVPKERRVLCNGDRFFFLYTAEFPRNLTKKGSFGFQSMKKWEFNEMISEAHFCFVHCCILIWTCFPHTVSVQKSRRFQQDEQSPRRLL